MLSEARLKVFKNILLTREKWSFEHIYYLGPGRAMAPLAPLNPLVINMFV